MSVGGQKWTMDHHSIARYTTEKERKKYADGW